MCECILDVNLALVPEKKGWGEQYKPTKTLNTSKIFKITFQGRLFRIVQSF